MKLTRLSHNKFLLIFLFLTLTFLFFILSLVSILSEIKINIINGKLCLMSFINICPAHINKSFLKKIYEKMKKYFTVLITFLIFHEILDY